MKALVVIALALLVGSAAVAAPIHGQGTWESTLKARDLDGNGSVDAFYDTDLNITWMADPGRSNDGTFCYVVGPSMDVSCDGSYLTFGRARGYAYQLDVGGIRGWRLTHATSENCLESAYEGGVGGSCGDSPNPSLSEFAHLYYVTLGNQSVAGVPRNTGPFSSILEDRRYMTWTDTAMPYMNDWAIWFRFDGGFLSPIEAIVPMYAWVVHDGDVGAPITAVPEPSQFVLMVIGAVALLVRATRRSRPASEAR
jgi:hypothetical protein